MGVDARWEHTIVVFNAAGDIVESWTQWDKMMRRPHAVYINPWDPQKHVWIVDDHEHAVFKMTNDGKQIVMTLGTPNKAGADATHFNRPTFLAFLPDSSVFVADGYNGNRVAKFDKDGKFLWTSGMLGMPGGRETRPGYFNTVHGIAADPVTRRVYVSDRSNRRIQVLDGDSGKPLDWWPVGDQTNLQFLIIPPDRSGIWGFTDTTAKIAKWDFNGRLLYSWGVLGDFPGSFLNMHGASTDQEGNLYTVEVGGGRVQKFRPRKGANPAYLGRATGVPGVEVNRFGGSACFGGSATRDPPYRPRRRDACDDLRSDCSSGRVPRSGPGLLLLLRSALKHLRELRV